MSYPPANPTTLSKSALLSFIFGILGCIPFVTSILAFFLGIVGIFATGKPGVRGRWMAVVGVIFAVIGIGFWSTAGLGLVMGWRLSVAPGHGARDFIRAVDVGNETVAKDLTVMNDADYDAAKALIKAQGGFVDSTFSNVQIINNDAHVAGTGDFKAGTRNITADVVKIDGKWKVKSLTISP